MSRTPSATTTSLRDQLAAALRDANGPLSARQLGTLCSASFARPCDRDGGHEIPRQLDDHWRSITCHGDYDIVVAT